jgi:hypothetical protein
MLETVENTTTDKQTIYKFRFNSSDKLIQLTQSHIDRIPYLQALVAHKDDFSSIQNDQDEYVLHPPIHYNWFMAIFHSIITEQPYTLFTELPEDDNILDVLQLLDYLGINSFSSPLLKEPNIIVSKRASNEDERKRIVYERANSLSEARNTAAKFVIALTKNEYNLHDFKTIECIFSLISVTFSDGRVFNSRFRHHTFTIVEEYVFPLFYIKNSAQLLATLEQRNAIDSEIYLYDNTQPLPIDFENAFAWKGSYRSIEDSYRSIKKNSGLMEIARSGLGKSFLTNLMVRLQKNNCSTVDSNSTFSYTFYDTPGLFDIDAHTGTTLLVVDPVVKELYINEAQSARSGHFNTVPKRLKVDKFKHRCGPKAQKHR